MKFPQHKGSLSLYHNEHKSVYVSVKDAIETKDLGYQDDQWISAEEKQRAIDTDECWSLQWYPETPVSFIVVSASTLEALMEHVDKTYW